MRQEFTWQPTKKSKHLIRVKRLQMTSWICGQSRQSLLSVCESADPEQTASAGEQEALGEDKSRSGDELCTRQPRVQV